MPKCNRCRDEIEWGQLPTGLWVALDPTPNPHGEYVLLPGTTKLLSLDDGHVRALAARDPATVAPNRRARHAPRCDLRGLTPVGEAIRKTRR